MRSAGREEALKRHAALKDDVGSLDCSCGIAVHRRGQLRRDAGGATGAAAMQQMKQ